MHQQAEDYNQMISYDQANTSTSSIVGDAPNHRGSASRAAKKQFSYIQACKQQMHQQQQQSTNLSAKAPAASVVVSASSCATYHEQQMKYYRDQHQQNQLSRQIQGKENHANRDESFGGHNRKSNGHRVSKANHSRTATADPLYQSKRQLEHRQQQRVNNLSRNSDYASIYVDTNASENSQTGGKNAAFKRYQQPLRQSVEDGRMIVRGSSAAARREKRDERRSPSKRDSTESAHSNYRGSFQEAAARRQTHARHKNAQKEPFQEVKTFANENVQNHQENARIAQQRTDLKTLSEPTLVSSGEKFNQRDGGRAPTYLQATIRTRSDEHSDEKINRHESRFSTISHGGGAGGWRQRSIEESENRVSSQLMSSTENLMMISSNQAFQSQQFQMNRNQHQSAPRTSAGQSGNKTTHALAAHFYSKHYGGQANNNRGERSSGRRNGKPEEHNTHGNIANYLVAQPSQTMMYGRRDSKNTGHNNNQQSNAGHYYGNNTQKATSGAGSGASSHHQRESNHNRTSNLLAKGSAQSTAKDSYVGGIASSNLSSASGSNHHNQIQQNKQQIIQNLNQRYLSGHNPAASQHMFDNTTNVSTQDSIKQLRQQHQTTAQTTQKARGQQQLTSKSSHSVSGTSSQLHHHQVPPTAQHHGYVSTGHTQHRPETTVGLAHSRGGAKPSTAAQYFASQSMSNQASAAHGQQQKRDSNTTSNTFKPHYDIRPRTSIEIGSANTLDPQHQSLQPQQAYPQQQIGMNQSVALSTIGGSSVKQGINSNFMSATIDSQTSISMIPTIIQNPTRVSFVDDQTPHTDSRQPTNLATNEPSQASGSNLRQSQESRQVPAASRQNMMLANSSGGATAAGLHHQIKGRNLNSNIQKSGGSSHLMTDGSIDYRSGSINNGANTVQSSMAKSYQNVLNSRMGIGAAFNSNSNVGDVLGQGTVLQSKQAQAVAQSQTFTKNQQQSTQPNNASATATRGITKSASNVHHNGNLQQPKKVNAGIIEHVMQRNKNYSHKLGGGSKDDDANKRQLDEGVTEEQPRILAISNNEQAAKTGTVSTTPVTATFESNKSNHNTNVGNRANEDEATILDLKQIEEMMRASLKNNTSNIFSLPQSNMTEASQERQSTAGGRHQSGYTASRKNDDLGPSGSSSLGLGAEDMLKRHYHATISSQEDRQRLDRGSRKRSSESRNGADSCMSSQQRQQQHQRPQSTLSVASRDGSVPGLNHSNSIVLNEVEISIASPVNNQQLLLQNNAQQQMSSSYQVSASTSKQHQSQQQNQSQLPQSQPHAQQQHNPQTIIIHQTQSPEAIQKAKHRLESVCQLLAENKNCSSNLASEQEKQHAAITSVLEQLVLCQQNQYDSQCMRLLMDYHYKAAGELQTRRLQDELQTVKKRFQAQQMLSIENKELKEKLQRQKIQLQEQERGVKKLERELEQIKVQFEVDKRETRIIRAETTSNNNSISGSNGNTAKISKTTTNQQYLAVNAQNSQQTAQQYKRNSHHHQQRAASHEPAVSRGASKVSRSSTLAPVPPLDLSKVKAYEDYMREKQAIKQQQQQAAKNKQLQNGATKSQNKHKTNVNANDNQMSTIQHHSTKLNNFVGGEVNLVKMNNKNASNTIQQHENNHNTIDASAGPHNPQNQYHRNTSQSLSPRTGGKQSGNNKLALMNRQSQQSYVRQSQPMPARPQTAAGGYSNSRDNVTGQVRGTSTGASNHANNHEGSFDNSKERVAGVRQSSHNYSSATIEGSRMVSQSMGSMVIEQPEINGGKSKNDSSAQQLVANTRENHHDRMVQSRKRSMPHATSSTQQNQQHQSRQHSTSANSSSQVHIPLLDFSKLHKPQSTQLHYNHHNQNQSHQSQQKQAIIQQQSSSNTKPGQQHQAQKKAMQPKQSMSSQNSHKQQQQQPPQQTQPAQQQHQQHFQTIEVQSSSKFVAAGPGGFGASDDYNDNSITNNNNMRHGGHAKKKSGGSYEQLANAMGSVQLRQSSHHQQHQTLHHKHSSGQQATVLPSNKDNNNGIGASQSMKLMQQQQQQQQQQITQSSMHHGMTDEAFYTGSTKGQHMQNNAQQQVINSSGGGMMGSLAVHSQVSSSQPSLKFTDSSTAAAGHC